MPRTSKPFAKKSFGQNFLVDETLVREIVAAVDLCPGDTILEIGPGRGALTSELLKSGGSIVAIELDRDLITTLENQFGKSHNFRLLSADALKVDYRQLRDSSEAKLKLVANLPYNIATAILQRLIDYRHDFSEMVLMFQREVVERITAGPGSSDRGYLTVLVEQYFSIERLVDVPPTAFRPQPQVWSSVVKLVPSDDSAEIVGRENDFASLVSAGFRQKRKTILNNLKAAPFINPSGKDIVAALTEAGIDPLRRAETLTGLEWIALLIALT